MAGLVPQNRRAATTWSDDLTALRVGVLSDTGGAITEDDSASACVNTNDAHHDDKAALWAVATESTDIGDDPLHDGHPSRTAPRRLTRSFARSAARLCTRGGLVGDSRRFVAQLTQERLKLRGLGQ